jgi:cysteine desulfurase
VTTAIEHEAVLNTVKALSRRGWRVTLVPVGASGIVSAEAVAAEVTDETALVSVMHANNEIGTVQPLEAIAAAAHARGAVVHTDAVQTAGKLPIDVRRLGVDLLSISAHKFYGPKGVGALWVRRGVRLTPFITGGRQERGRRAGTENVAGIAGLGCAAAVAREKLAVEAPRLRDLRDRLERGVLAAIPGAERNGAAEPRVANTSNISLERVESESVLIGLDLEGIAVSSGSACSSGTLEPSHVLKAMGLPHARTLGSIRFSLGASNTEAEIDRVVAVLPKLVDKLRNLTVGPRR